MAMAFEDEGLTAPDRSSVLSIVGLSLTEAMHRLVPGASDEKVARLVEGYRASFHRRHSNPMLMDQLYPGAGDCLLRLSQRPDTLLGIATGKSRRGVNAMIEMHKLGGLFVTVQTADEHPSKPHPAMLLAALAETGVAPERTVMIGDSSYDMTMARAAGTFALGVTWGYQTGRSLEAAGAQRLVGEYAAVDAVIEDLLGPAFA
jgi:phosphoglycolate phosphatase